MANIINPFPKPPESAQKICPEMMIPVADKLGVRGMNFGTCVGDKCGKFNACSGNLKQLSDIELALHGIASQIQSSLESVTKSNYNGQV